MFVQHSLKITVSGALGFAGYCEAKLTMCTDEPLPSKGIQGKGNIRDTEVMNAWESIQ